MRNPSDFDAAMAAADRAGATLDATLAALKVPAATVEMKATMDADGQWCRRPFLLHRGVDGLREEALDGTSGETVGAR